MRRVCERRRYLPLLVIVGGLVGLACSWDGSTGPPSATVGLQLRAADLNTCDTRFVERSSTGALRLGDPVRTRVSVPAEPHDTVITRYGKWNFDAQGQQTRSVECILLAGTSASAFMRGPNSPDVDRSVASSIGVGTTCYWVGDSYDIMCGNVRCFAMFALRAEAGAALRASPVIAVGGKMANAGVYTWECQDGGGISVSGGVVTYHTPNTGGDEGGGGGGSGGCSVPSDSGPPQMDELRWSAACDSVPIAALCIPQVGVGVPMDTSCYRPLSTNETAVIQEVLNNYLASTRRMRDTVASRVCAAGAQAIRQALQDGRLFAGKTPLTKPSGAYHEGATDSLTGRVHVDPWHLADAMSNALPIMNFKPELALTLVHEGLHLLNEPPHTTGEPYTTPPWDRLNSKWLSPSSPSPCVIWS